MKNFEKLKKERPEIVADLETMTIEELKEHYAIEVMEKQELEKYKEDSEFFKNDIENIINLAKKWLVDNKKTKHHIHISIDKIELIYQNVESEWI